MKTHALAVALAVLVAAHGARTVPGTATPRPRPLRPTEEMQSDPHRDLWVRPMPPATLRWTIPF